MTAPSDPVARALALPIWSGTPTAVPLGGGITNLNVLVTDATRRAVVRIGDDIPVHQIMRFNELAASRAAHAAGVSPAVLHHEPGALVIDFVRGRTMTAASPISIALWHPAFTCSSFNAGCVSNNSSRPATSA